MRHFSPDAASLPGTIPSDMDNDPRADEEVINQNAGEQYPRPVEGPVQGSDLSAITSVNLADPIAYALDGSGPGPTGDTPNVPGHAVITRGTTGAGLDQEEDPTPN